MAFQLVIIWTLVIAVTVWFFRDERQRAARRLQQRAAHFASSPAYRYEVAVPAQDAQQPATRRSSGLSDTQRRYFEELAKQGQ